MPRKSLLAAAALMAFAGLAGQSVAATYIYPDGTVVRTPKHERGVQPVSSPVRVRQASPRRAHPHRVAHHHRHHRAAYHRHGHKVHVRGGHRYYYGQEHDLFLDRRI